MSNNPVDENFYEQVLIALFKEMGYQYECGYDVERDYREPFLAEDLRKGLRRLNPMVSNTVLEDALRLITNVNEGTLEQRNEQLLRGDETAYPFEEKQHGMFTYYLLKKIQETKGEVTLGDLGDYLTNEVARQSFIENGKKQTPTATPSASFTSTWREETLK